MRPHPVKKIRFKDRFKKDYRKLSEDLQRQVDKAIGALKQDPLPRWLRFEKLKGYRNPAIYTIHVTPNHSHKISFEMNGDEAILRRIGTHKEIDKRP